jgi:hypothetical protein
VLDEIEGIRVESAEHLRRPQQRWSELMSVTSTRDAALDNAAVDAFTAAMRAKLALKRDAGFAGWEGVSIRRLRELLDAAVAKGDPVDVGNYAMMIHYHQQADKAKQLW